MASRNMFNVFSLLSLIAILPGGQSQETANLSNPPTGLDPGPNDPSPGLGMPNTGPLPGNTYSNSPDANIGPPPPADIGAEGQPPTGTEPGGLPPSGAQPGTLPAPGVDAGVPPPPQVQDGLPPPSLVNTGRQGQALTGNEPEGLPPAVDQPGTLPVPGIGAGNPPPPPIQGGSPGGLPPPVIEAVDANDLNQGPNTIGSPPNEEQNQVRGGDYESPIQSEQQKFDPRSNGPDEGSMDFPAGSPDERQGVNPGYNVFNPDVNNNDASMNMHEIDRVLEVNSSDPNVGVNNKDPNVGENKKDPNLRSESSEDKGERSAVDEDRSGDSLDENNESTTQSVPSIGKNVPGVGTNQNQGLVAGNVSGRATKPVVNEAPPAHGIDRDSCNKSSEVGNLFGAIRRLMARLNPMRNGTAPRVINHRRLFLEERVQDWRDKNPAMTEKSGSVPVVSLAHHSGSPMYVMSSSTVSSAPLLKGVPTALLAACFAARILVR